MTSIHLLIFSLILNLQFEGKYERHNQNCGGINGTDLKWTLDVKKDVFVLQIKKQKNQYLSKAANTSITGTWQESGDTLKLYQWGKKDEALTFYKKNNRLIFQKNGQTLQNADLLYLDFLEKATK